MVKIIKPSFEILTPIDGEAILKLIELAGRTCYKSNDLITPDSARAFVEKLAKRGHESVIDHYNITVRFVCNRGFTHELVRHRLAAYSQESTRYCNYTKDKFGNEITVIKPCEVAEGTSEYDVWKNAMENAEKSYFALINGGSKPENARGVLPIDVKTEIVMTANLREWRHVFRMRTSPAAHPSMRELMIPLQKEFQRLIPVLFDVQS
ncbi:MAG: FAD-dependent thymidylate synthase [Rickettsiales bacterium]|jgi:thymidylate synthase (FAD)|nr:FAD-dependent thymidylate synthase [Rickettsiales bacterium]